VSSWHELVSTAVVGTERRAVPPGLASKVASIVEDEVAGGTVEEQVLVAAGVLATWRRVGAATPSSDRPFPYPAPSDERPAASAKAVQLLELLLDGHAAVGGASTDLAADWLARCERSGRRLPAGMLPRVMNAATAAPALRAAAAAAGGPRLRWLAARNAAWAWATGTTDPDAAPEQVWAEGTREERLAVLAALRASDPARARALLGETWSSEPAADRTRFVEALATGLSPTDEPFLEAALDDRSKAVRVAAAGLLAALPTSALARRMADRLRPLVSIDRREKGPIRRERTRLTVALPEGIDAAAARDGIVEHGAPRGTGRRAWALIQIIGATPLSLWEHELGSGPDGIVPLGVGSGEVLAGWARAAAHQRNVAWARQVLHYRQDPALLAALPQPEAHKALAAVLSHVDDTAVGVMLAATPAPWPLATSRAVIDRLRSIDNRLALLSALPVLPAAVDTSAAPDVEAWAASLRADDPVLARLRMLTQALAVRVAIARELA
jgi:hypothetical protein